jgi:hypothetical protein
MRGMIIRKEIRSLPPEPIRVAWCDWLQHHTVNPDVVCASTTQEGFIEIDYDAYQIRYLAYNLDDNGGRYGFYKDGDYQVSTSVRVTQLEARPSELPEVLQAT